MMVETNIYAIAINMIGLMATKVVVVTSLHISKKSNASWCTSLALSLVIDAVSILIIGLIISQHSMRLGLILIMQMLSALLLLLGVKREELRLLPVITSVQLLGYTLWNLVCYLLSICIKQNVVWVTLSLTFLSIIGFIVIIFKNKLNTVIHTDESKTAKTLLYLNVSYIVTCLGLSLYNNVTIGIVPVLISASLAYIICTKLLYQAALDSRMINLLGKEVSIDKLTNLPNRTAFFEDGIVLVNSGVSFDVVFIDLNRFKAINDKYGHDKGNEYLIGFGERLTEICEGIGTAYRLSGDEFTCIVKYNEGSVIADQLAQTNWSSYIGKLPFLGSACGVASYPIDSLEFDTLVKQADKNMYNEKDRLKHKV